MITCLQAESILQASRSNAHKIGIAVSVVVMDAGGNLKVLSRVEDLLKIHQVEMFKRTI